MALIITIPGEVEQKLSIERVGDCTVGKFLVYDQKKLDVGATNIKAGELEAAFKRFGIETEGLVSIQSGHGVNCQAVKLSANAGNVQRAEEAGERLQVLFTQQAHAARH